MGLLLVAVGIGTVFAGRWYLQREAERSNRVDPSEVRTTVFVAREDVPRGTRIEPDHIEPVTLVGSVPEGVVTDRTTLTGRVVLSDLLSGQFYMAGGISNNPADAGLASLIPVGHRAFSLRIDESIAAGEFLRPGDRVDIMVVLTERATGVQGEALTLLQNVQVLTVGQHLSPDQRQAQDNDDDRRREAAQMVSVAVTPADADRLLLARQLGDYAIALRNPDDSIIVERDAATLATLRDRLADVMGEEPPEMEEVAQHLCVPTIDDPVFNARWRIDAPRETDLIQRIWSGIVPEDTVWPLPRIAASPAPDAATEEGETTATVEDVDERDTQEMLIPRLLPASLIVRNNEMEDLVDPTDQLDTEETVSPAGDSQAVANDGPVSEEVECPTIPSHSAAREVLYIMGDRVETRSMEVAQ